MLLSLKNIEKRTRRHANNSQNLPTSWTKRTQGQNPPTRRVRSTQCLYQLRASASAQSSELQLSSAEAQPQRSGTDAETRGLGCRREGGGEGGRGFSAPVVGPMTPHFYYTIAACPEPLCAMSHWVPIHNDPPHLLGKCSSRTPPPPESRYTMTPHIY